MANIFLFLLALGLVLLRVFTFPAVDLSLGVTTTGLEFLLSGLRLFNNLTSFSMLSFVDYTLSNPNGSPISSLFLLPIFSVLGPNIENLVAFKGLSRSLSFLFLSIWIFEMKREGNFQRSKAVFWSCVFLSFSTVALLVLRPADYTSQVAMTLVTVSALYYFRALSYRNNLIDSTRQARAFRSLSIVFLFSFLCDIKIALVSFLFFLTIELRQSQLEHRKKLFEMVLRIFGFNRQPFLALLMYLPLLLFAIGYFSKELIPFTTGFIFYLCFAFFFLRVFILYQNSFLDLIKISWQARQVLNYFLFPAGLWLLYPTPNRFEPGEASGKTPVSESIPLSKREAIRESLLPILADDRRVKVYGVSEEDAVCKLLEFELKKTFPGWSRNPETVLCAKTPEKIEASVLEQAFDQRVMRTLLVFHKPRTLPSFEVALFLKKSNAVFEKIPFSLKGWGLEGTLFYLADKEF